MEDSVSVKKTPDSTISLHETDMDLMPSSEERPSDMETSHANDISDSKSSTSISVTNSHDFGGKNMMPEGSDTEDDFFSVKGEFSRSCSNASSRRDSFGSVFPSLKEEEGDWKGEKDPLEEKKNQCDQLFQDSLCESNQTDHNNNQRIRLLEFLEDECWNEEIARITATPTPSRAEEERLKSKEQHLSSKKGCSSMVLVRDDKIAKQYHSRKVGNKHCCFPSLGPRRTPKD
ncbi:uncharacterized protein LOC125369753 isoform X1 [Ricinus communis]|uniref:Uncharacterized protein n=1 Tax=Ricinus communis TaxID=3988 RepID=B9RAI0_RICCO|nr:uncharacterized protein LOC125369753 isoform X1 [Ricinus communis]EEF51807.1 conserved hypothetical protein [Ricinus communis]